MSASRTSFLTVSLVATAAVVAGCSSTDDAEPRAADGAGETITITDEQDREVVLPAEVDRVVSINSYNTELLVALGAGETIVGVDDRSVFRAPYGGFTDDDVVGVDFESLNYEKIVEADPDVVFIPRNGVWEDAASTLEQFDIPVVVLTVWDPTIWTENVELVAEIVGAPERADEILEFTDGVHALVAERVEGLERVPVYYEDGEAFSSAGSNSGKTVAIADAGGRNIFEDVGINDGLVITVDPVDVIAADPAVILREDISQFPPYEQDSLRASVDELLAREGWSQLSAVRSGRVVVYNAGPLDAAGRTFSSLYFGAWIHPEAFADVDPDEYVRQWAQEFLGSDFDATTGYVQTPGD
ncbi:ABC transporter substrate-binding protein [Jiangella endophytica]|uniref:ABC transporter substrate-binding protein n=1 Tax=Jiangella endophytica TaxID=1623398 RepID=UPI000E340D1C|nr:ABC transporter substrate-binding protein [Jiangella endophytica]